MTYLRWVRATWVGMLATAVFIVALTPVVGCYMLLTLALIGTAAQVIR